MLSISPKDIPISQLHSYLLNAVAPRPIAFASTTDANGNPNLSPFSFFNVFSANPPIVIFSPARRVRDNTIKHTLANVEATKEVVINVVNHAIVQQMSLSSTEYDKGVNEFTKAGLSMLKSTVVKPFRVAESPIQLECKVNDIIYLGQDKGAGNLVICEVVKLHINKSVLNDDNTINQEQLDLVARAGGSYYSRAKDGFFEIPKPIKTKGIGVDVLPEHIKNSTILTGNNLGMLGNVEALPTQQEVQEFITDAFKKCSHLKDASIEDKHKKAQDYLNQNKVESALKLLMS